MKKILTIALVLLSAGVVLSVYVYTNVYNKPHTDVYHSQADYTVSAGTIIDEFKTDEQKANTKYLDKIIQVHGEIRKIDIVNGLSSLTLHTGDGLESVICNMDPGENKKILKLETGQTIQAKGICTGYLLDVVIVRAVLVEENL